VSASNGNGALASLPLVDGSSGKLMTAEETGELLSVKKSWVYAETRAGRIPHVKLGRYYRYRREAIEAWVADLEQGPTPYRKYAPGLGPGGLPHE